MVTESSLDMLSEFGVGTLRGSGGSGGEDVGKELGGVLREQRRQQQEASNLELELNLYRSGSAPPTVEGSLSAVGGLFRSIGGLTAGSELSGSNGALSEEELRSDPAYHSYYYSHVNLNPRLPPPILSKEDSRFAQRLQAGGSSAGLGRIGDRRKAANGNQVENGGSRSLFALQRGFDSQKEENEVEGMKSQPNEWLERGGDGLIGLPGLGLMGRKKSFGDILQDDLGCATFRSAHPSRPVSRNAVDNSMEAMASAEAQFAQLRHEITSTATLQGIPGSGSHSFVSTLGTSLSRSTTPDPQMVARVPSPRLPPVGERIDKKFFNGSTSFMKSSNVTESTDLIAALSSMNLSANGMVDESYHLQSKRQSDIEAHQNSIFDLQGDQAHIKKPHYNQIKSVRTGMKHSPFLADELSASSGDTFLKIPNSPTSINMRASPHFQNLESPNQVDTSYGLGTYSLNPASPSIIGSQLGASNLPPLFENVSAVASALAGSTFNSRLLGGLPPGPNSNGIAAEMQNVTGLGNHAALHMPMMDPLYFQYLKSAEYAAQLAVSLNDPSLNRNLMGSSYVDQLELQKAYLETLLSPQNSQFGIPFMGTSSTLSHGYYGNSAVGLDMSYPRSPMLPAPPLGPGSPIRHNDRPLCFTSGMRGFAGSAMGSCRTDISFNMDEGFASSLLENFKSNKTKCFELSEISGHVVEFSADQYGSRFIQQKLETATTEEKDTVFKEIIPHALSLMTDVFGNYVIQKFFEHGSAEQRRELANQLTGHVLTLSLQMYGCRVIQKAIEVVDLDQQTKMVAELEGNIMRCVRDQNGNHVIQKCIECIPQDAIEFIISSFYDQVVTLSTHPYGCRVIQRVLEHCDDPKTQQIMMDEILHSVCMLAQDQYGNYVVQHVLEHGKPHERAAIIQKLAGQIVQMSQQKFASNVVEKCLTFGEPEERQFLVNEMLGTTDENEPLQAMMKDQFANYVVQKVLETCEDHQRELILSRIKVHLNALKKYTYGKHIVARVEKLVAAGERRIGMQSAYPSSLMDKKEGYLYS